MAKQTDPIMFVVQGTREFPFDMLRYDRCWPATQADVVNLSPHPRNSIYREQRKVMMNGLRTPTTARWKSFGWKVVEDFS